jgi:hypothetical protein
MSAESESQPARPTFCTIVTKSHLSLARALARSITANHPAAQIYVLLADRLDGLFDPLAEPFHLLSLEDLGHAETIRQMTFYYTPFELCCALRPFLHDYLWRETTAASWVFLDSDIHVVSALTDTFDALDSASLLLNPHNNAPPRPEFAQITELGGLTHGVFNGGFLGVRRSEPARQFIDWFADRMIRYCFFNVPGLFVDQAWLGHVPHYFRDVHSYTHPGANLGHWNLYQRNLTTDDRGSIHADGKPLLFVHFSGWRIDEPTIVSRQYAPAYEKLQLPQTHVWGELGLRYRAALMENGYEQCRNWPYAFAQFDDGAPITPAMRHHYYNQLWSGPRQPGMPSPFSRAADFAHLRGQ